MTKTAPAALLAASVATLAIGVIISKAFSMWKRVQEATKEADAGSGGHAVETQADADDHSNRSNRSDCRLTTANNFLLVLGKVEGDRLVELADAFCGRVITRDQVHTELLPSTTVFLCGDAAMANSLGLEAAKRVLVIGELSQNCDGVAWPIVDIGRVPILVHGVGVLYRRLFETRDYFRRVHAEHTFQSLTESTKPGTAHRKGIYLTPVEERGDAVHFRLLRCSSNFSGPTLNFGECDAQICAALNVEAEGIFDKVAPLNHVLAQVYTNTPATATAKQTKAKIKAHSDKTKDMPRNGLMAFCTFYDQLERLEPFDGFDYGHRGVSGLTKLHFRLKEGVTRRGLTPQFSVTLYPNSAFFMPLETNRLYTHEIRPAPLDAHLLPTRMGYVVRCSECEAVHQDGRTLIKTNGGGLAPLEPPTTEGMARLRELYADENVSDSVFDYGKGGPLLFSMNAGDYARPLVRESAQAEEFRALSLHTDSNLFEPLMASVEFEDVGKGRQGTVLVQGDDARGCPIVRTTSKYAQPAQCFQQLHERLARQIEACASLSVGLNNALVECYTSTYTKMGFHSDLALDLQEGSSIALFSCYRHPDRVSTPRKLVVVEKEHGAVPSQADLRTFEIPLVHNSVIVFGLDANRRFRHKIVLEGAVAAPTIDKIKLGKTKQQKVKMAAAAAADREEPAENEWLGVTFRTSKTFVKASDGCMRFADGAPLTLADESQSKEFYTLRARENAQTDFEYPRIEYTLSESDLMPPSQSSCARLELPSTFRGKR